MIGGGKMGQALIGGLLDAEWAQPHELAVVEILAPLRHELSGRFPGVTITDEALPGVDAVVAVKPHHVLAACRRLVSPGRVVSIAAGITITAIEATVPDGTPVIRVMPNTPALVGAGASALAPGSSADDDDVAWAVGILEAVGAVAVVAEPALDAVTGLSGSGPAYVFLIAEALIDAGVAAGLTADVARLLAVRTIEGAGRLLAETGTPPAELRAAVTTPAGTTAAGLRVLERRAVRSALIDAVAAAADRSRELGAGG